MENKCSNEHDLHRNIHFLDYSLSGLANSIQQDTPQDETAFEANRDNLRKIFKDESFFYRFLSDISDPKSAQKLAIPIETAPFFRDYIAVLQKHSDWKNLSQQEATPEFVAELLENTYASIKSDPDRLSYYEKVLFQMDEYCSFVAAKLWADELDYRCDLLKELVSKRSGREQLEGLSNLLRMLDTYIAVYSEPVAKAPEESAAELLEKIPQTLYQQVRQNMRKNGESATEFLLRQEFEPFPFEYEKKPNERRKDSEAFKTIDGQAHASLETIYHIERSTRYFNTETRSRIKEEARKIYLSSLGSSIAETHFQETYQNIRNYLNPIDTAPSEETVLVHAQNIMCPYCSHILEHGSTLQRNHLIDRNSSITDVMLDALTKPAAEYFVLTYPEDLFNFKCIKDFLSGPQCRYPDMSPYANLPYESPEKYRQLLIRYSNHIFQCMVQYVGGSFEKAFLEICPSFDEIATQQIVYTLYSKIYNLFLNAKEKLSLSFPQTVDISSFQYDIVQMLEHLHKHDSNQQAWDMTKSSQFGCYMPVLHYVLFTLKTYYYFIESANEVTEAYQQYRSAMEKHRREYNKEN